MGTALAARMPPEQVMACIEQGMGKTLGFIAVVVGLGAMFGQMLEASGGAERLTLTLLRVFGRRRAAWAMTLAGFLVAIPVFFDVGFIILVPLVYALSRETKRSLLAYGIPLLAGLAVTHAFVPPTPGPIAVAQLVGADLGRVIFYGVLLGLPCAVLAGPVFGGWIADRIPAGIPAYMENAVAKKRWDEKDLPGFGTVFGILLLPLALILLNTVTNAALPEGHPVRTLCAFVVIAIAAGATAISHVNDSGFWLVNRYFGLSTKDTLRSWTVMETIIGVTGATLAWLASKIV